MELLKIFKNKNNEFKIFFKDKCLIKEYSIEKEIQYNYKNNFASLKKNCFQLLFTENNKTLFTENDKNEIIEILKKGYSCVYAEKTTDYVLSINSYKNENFEKDKNEIEKYLKSLKLEKKSYKEIELYEFLFSEEYKNLKNNKVFLNSNKYYIKKMWKELLK